MELALGKRQGLSRISGLLGTQSVLRLEAVWSSSRVPIALCSVLVSLTMKITTQLVLTHKNQTEITFSCIFSVAGHCLTVYL